VERHNCYERGFNTSTVCTRILTIVTRRVSLVQHELHTLPEHPNSFPVVLWDSCFSMFSFLCNVLYITVCLVLWYIEAFLSITNMNLRGYHTLQGDNSLKSVERFDHMMFVCRFQASWWSKPQREKLHVASELIALSLLVGIC
jgi:hypothetical protein